MRCVSLCLLLALSWPVTGYADALDLIVGSWGVEAPSEGASEREIEIHARRSCGASALTVTIDRSSMRYRSQDIGDGYVEVADILDHSAKHLTIRYDDETRVMANGQPHVWHAFFVDDDTFVWILGETLKDRDGIVPQPRVRCRTLAS